MSPSETVPLNKTWKPTYHHRQSTTSFRWALRRGRQRLPTVRLGGKKPRRGSFLFRVCRRAKLKWLRLKYLGMLKKLKKYCDAFVKDIVQLNGTAKPSLYQQRLLSETSLVVPVMGL